MCVLSRPEPCCRHKETHVAKDDIEPEEIDEDIDLEEGDDLDLIEDDELDDDGLLEDDDEDDDDSLGATIVRKATDDDEDDDDMVAPDDVEEDLAEILKDRLASEQAPDDEDDQAEPDEKGGEDALQPKRADEVLCKSCFMLVRKNAPVCPMGDDACPTIKK